VNSKRTICEQFAQLVNTLSLLDQLTVAFALNTPLALEVMLFGSMKGTGGHHLTLITFLNESILDLASNTKELRPMFLINAKLDIHQISVTRVLVSMELSIKELEIISAVYVQIQY
jgi:hypothetical protein